MSGKGEGSRVSVKGGVAAFLPKKRGSSFGSKGGGIRVSDNERAAHLMPNDGGSRGSAKGIR